LSNDQPALALRYGEVQFFESIVSIEFAGILQWKRFEFIEDIGFSNPLIFNKYESR
jgi:hypothetical protein